MSVMPVTASDNMKSDEKTLVHQVEKKYIFYNKGENISATLNLVAFKSLIKTLPRIATCPVWKSLRLTRSFLAPTDSRNQTISRSSWASSACPPSGSFRTASTSPSRWSPTSCSSASGRWRQGMGPGNYNNTLYHCSLHKSTHYTLQDSFEKGGADV